MSLHHTRVSRAPRSSARRSERRQHAGGRVAGTANQLRNGEDDHCPAPAGPTRRGHTPLRSGGRPGRLDWRGTRGRCPLPAVAAGDPLRPLSGQVIDQTNCAETGPARLVSAPAVRPIGAAWRSGGRDAPGGDESGQIAVGHRQAQPGQARDLRSGVGRSRLEQSCDFLAAVVARGLWRGGAGASLPDGSVSSMPSIGPGSSVRSSFSRYSA